MASAIIIDSDKEARKTLINLIEFVCPWIQVVGEAEGVKTGLEVLQTSCPDFVFLDTQLKGGTGFDLLDYLPKTRFRLILTSAYSRFALKAFQYATVDYLVKPISSKHLVRAIYKFREGSWQSDNQSIKNASFSPESRGQKIFLTTQEGLHILTLAEIVRLESDGSYTRFFPSSGSPLLVTKNLKSCIFLLPAKLFARPHQSFLVNINHIRKVLREDGGYVIMSDESKIPISRRKKEAFFKALNRQNHL